jgi:uncharacterized protein (DUF433 family)
MSQLNDIAVDPGVASGQSVVRSNCLLVLLILGYLAHGETLETILRDFPSISEEDARAVLAFAERAGDQLPAPFAPAGQA